MGNIIDINNTNTEEAKEMIKLDFTSGAAQNDADLQQKIYFRWANAGPYSYLLECQREIADVQVSSNSYYAGARDEMVYDLALEVEKHLAA